MLAKEQRLRTARGWRASVAVLALAASVTCSSWALAQQAYNFNVPGGALAAAITKIATTAGISIAFPAKLAQGKTAPPISGSMSVEAALALALAGSGLEAVSSSGNGFAIRQAGAGAAATAPVGDVAAVEVTEAAASAHGDAGFKAGNAGDMLRIGDAPIKETPVPISAVTKDAIRAQGLTNPADAVRGVAGVIFDGAGNGQSTGFSVRGFGGSGYTINGVASNSANTLPIDAIERVEVLRGPTSILTGVSADGGNVNIVMKTATSETIREVTTRFGSRGMKEVALDLGGMVPQSSNLSYRFVASGMHTDQTEAGYQDTNGLYLAPSLKYSGETVTVSADVSYNKRREPYERPWAFLAQNVNDGRLSLLSTPPGVALAVNKFASNAETLTAQTGQTLKLGKLFDTIEVSVSNTFSYTKGWYYGHGFTIAPLEDAGAPFFGTSYTDSEDSTRGARPSVSFKYAGGWLKSNTQIGYDYSKQEMLSSVLSYDPGATIDLKRPKLITPFDFRNPPAGTSPYNSTTQITNDGMYIVQKLDLFENLHLLGNLRKDRNVFGSATNTTPMELNERSGTSYITGAAYDLTKQITPYINYSDGFVPGLIQGDKPTPPEGRRQKEIGARVSMFDDKFSIRAGVYDLARTNVSIAEVDRATRKLKRVIQVPGLNTTGFELEAQGEILPGWSVIGSYTRMYMDAGDVSVYGRGANPLSMQARDKASLWSTYSFPTQWLQQVTVGAGARAISTSFANVAADPIPGNPDAFDIKGYVIADALVGFNQDGWDVQFKVNNILDRQTLMPTTNTAVMTYEAGRSWVLTMRKSF